MRPFSSFGVSPFLWADEAALREIQRRFYELSRLIHPDRTAGLPESEREALETRAAELNADYAKLRDPWKLLESVLAGRRGASSGDASTRRSAPPSALAMDYFELQEKLAEEGPGAGVNAVAAELRSKAASELEAAEAAALEYARRFPFAGFGENTSAAPPWTDTDLEELARRMDRVRFARSFLRDFDAKFPRDTA